MRATDCFEHLVWGMGWGGGVILTIVCVCCLTNYRFVPHDGNNVQSTWPSITEPRATENTKRLVVNSVKGINCVLYIYVQLKIMPLEAHTYTRCFPKWYYAFFKLF